MTALKGKTVKVHYKGTLENGDVFDSSIGRSPLEFTIGAGKMIKGFDDGVTGMKVGDKRTLKLPPEIAYGERKKDLVFSLSKKSLPKGYTPELGDHLQMKTISGEIITAKVLSIQETELTLDANHELAGKTLTFEVEMMEIKD